MAMDWFTRRQFLIGCLGSGVTLAAGCQQQSGHTALPAAPWPTLASRPLPQVDRARHLPVSTPEPSGVPHSTAGVSIIPRSQWTDAKPILSRINRMGRIDSITVHHEGMTYPVTFTDLASSRAEICRIHHAHVDGRGWADIGYHFVIDRAGRIWETRPLLYQGAHVKNHNEHNIGVMLLGNFDIQSPSREQLGALAQLVRGLRLRFRVSAGRIFTHQELMPTNCPGRALQPQVASMRQRGVFV
jgi:hypothetical protein